MQIVTWGKVLVVSAALTMFASPASAQDDDEGPMTQGEDARYVRAVLVKYKPGKRERAFEIISEHFKPAGDKAGTPHPIGTIHYQTGAWDAIYVWKMDGGMADLEWYRTENDIKWFAALVEQEGGEEAAGELIAEYQATIDRAEMDVGHYHEETKDSDE